MADNVIKIIFSGVDEVSGVTDDVGDALSGLGKAALAASVVAVGAVAGIGAGLVKLAIDAAPLADIKLAFESMAGAAGSSADDVLAAFKKQSAGMVTNAAAMEAYNQATMLVSAEFAETLPEAMGYLGKVSAATGVDMDYLLASLTTGVGRLSPMILDNLQIQVDLNEAYADWSDETGIAVSEMTKQQQQAALTAQVMGLLAENTASLPDVTGKAATGMAAMKATMIDMKDSVALALQPALMALLEPLGELIETYGPAVTEWLGVAAEWLGTNLPIAIEAASSFINDKLVPAFNTIVGFIRENATPILAGLGAVLLVTVVPAFIAWAAAAIASAAATVIALAPVVLPIIAIGAAVALLVKAWDSDWLGIRTTLTAVWDEKLKPIFETIKEWLDKTIPIALEFLSDLWENTLKPALETVWAFIQDNLVPLFEVVVELLGVTLSLALTALAGLWQNVLEPALRAVWEFIKDNLQPVFDVLKTFLEVGFVVAIGIAKGVIDGIKGAFDGVAGAIQSVIGWVQGVIDKLNSISLPDWLTPGSPTPFEMGLRGISSALKDVAREGMPQLEASFAMAGAPSLGLSGNGNGNGNGHGGITIHNHFGADSVRSERDIYRIAENQEKSFRLRGVRTL